MFRIRPARVVSGFGRARRVRTNPPSLFDRIAAVNRARALEVGRVGAIMQGEETME